MIDTTTRSDRLQWISTVARVVLGVIMLWAGIAKVTEPSQALRAVQAYRILPPSLDDIVAVALPLLEIAVGVLLVIGLGTRLASGIAGVLMVVFVAGVASAWIRGLSIDCGCFGGGGDVVGGDTAWRYGSEILRDVGLLALATWLLRFPASRFAADRLVDVGGVTDMTDDDADDRPER
jgi:uncharacterized membrane protein YphA (DoxX/SURF4 family)